MIIVGFCAYITVEVVYRGYSYTVMGLMGSIVFLLIDTINERFGWDTELFFQATLGGIYATLVELIFGLLDRGYWHIRMWNYADEYFNFQGIICLKFSIYWCLLALLAVLVADFINYCLDRKADPPYYVILGKKYTPSIYSKL